jgi:hypothetical protein
MRLMSAISLVILLSGPIAVAEEGNPLIKEIPIEVSFANNDNSQQPQRLNPLLADVEVVVKIENGNGGFDSLAAFNIPFEKEGSFGPGNHFKVNPALTNLSKTPRTIIWDGKYEKDQKTIVPKAGDIIHLEFAFRTATGTVNQRVTHTMRMQYDFNLPLTAIAGGKRVSAPNKLVLQSALKVEFESALGQVKKNSIDDTSTRNGFYIYKVNPNGTLADDPPVKVAVQYPNAFTMKTRTGAEWVPAASGKYRAYSLAVIKVINDAEVRNFWTSTNVYGLDIEVSNVKPITVEITHIDIDPYGLGQRVKIGIDKDERGGPESIRQFPEMVRIDVTAKRQGQIAADFNGDVMIKDKGDIFPQTFFAGPDLPGFALRADSVGEWTVPVEAGKGSVIVKWVASAGQRRTKAQLEASIVGGDGVKSGKVQFSSWNDEVSLEGNACHGKVVKGGNGIPDWVDVMVSTSVGTISSSGTDSAKTVKRLRNYSIGAGSHPDTGMSAGPPSKQPKTDVRVNEVAFNFRPAQNSPRAFEGRTFKRSKSPFLNALTHESRHAYWNDLNQLNDVSDNDFLPGVKDGNGIKILNDETKRVEFNFPAATGNASTIQDPDVDLKDSFSDRPTSVTTDMNVAEDFTEVKPGQYSWVWVVPDLTKLEMLVKDKEEPRFKIGDLTLTYGFKQAEKIPGTNSAIKIDTISAGLGQVRFLIGIAGNDDTDAIKKLLNAAARSATYRYPSKGDGQSRHELDAYAFTEREEPDDQ